MTGDAGGTNDPTALLRRLQSDTTLTRIDAEHLRGDATTKFRVTTTRKTIDRSSRSTQKVSFEIWADDNGRLRKIAADDDVMRPMGGEFTMEFFDYGVKVDVQPPAKADVIERGLPILGNDEALKLTGDWTEVQSGAEHGVDWGLWYAPASGQQVCYSMHTDPKFENSIESPIIRMPGGEVQVTEPVVPDEHGTTLTEDKAAPVNESPRHGDDPSFCTFNSGSSPFGAGTTVFDGNNGGSCSSTRLRSRHAFVISVGPRPH